MRKFIAAAVAAASIAGIAAAPASARSTHWCRQGDPPIQASTRTSCAFAGAAVSAYANAAYGVRRTTLRVYSPNLDRFYTVRFVRRGGFRDYGGTVTATGRRGVWLRFSGDI